MSQFVYYVQVSHTAKASFTVQRALYDRYCLDHQLLVEKKFTFLSGIGDESMIDGVADTHVAFLFTSLFLYIQEIEIGIICSQLRKTPALRNVGALCKKCVS